MQFQTHYTHVRSKPESNNEPRITETAGYIPAQVRINNIMLAGQKLKEYRAEQYDFADGQVNHELFDPTRRKNFDLADAGILRNETNERLMEQQKALKQQQKDVIAKKEAEYTQLKADAEKARTEPKNEI